jgi:K+-transporting ATPase KdpF subunit
MTTMPWIAAAIALGLFVYLLVALILPERFE